MPQLVIGLDPAYEHLPPFIKSDKLPNIIKWGTMILDAMAGHCVGVKFQSAYFEAYGMHGYDSLRHLIEYAKQKKYKLIMDAKRGDIGSTSKAYAEAYLSPTTLYQKNAFCCDYLTVNPLMGEDCLMPFIDVAVQHNRGIFVLLETSNPGASMILKETSQLGNKINEKIAEFIQAQHQRFGIKGDQIGPIGVVIGATNVDCAAWRKWLPNSLFLMPGVGAQGGSMKTAMVCETKRGNGVWVPISRGITNVTNAQDEFAFKEGLQKNIQVFKKQLIE